mgnify:CR=1 FL=1
MEIIEYQDQLIKKIKRSLYKLSQSNIDTNKSSLSYFVGWDVSSGLTKIRSQIMKFCPKAIEIADRSEAILTGVNQLKKGDALIIAGKGHENLQIYGNNEYPFNDAEEASFAIKALEENL